MKHQVLLMILFGLFLLPKPVQAQENAPAKKEQVLDFSAGVIEGELTRPSILMELSSNFKDYDDLLLIREDFNSFHAIDSVTRLRYFEEKK